MDNSRTFIIAEAGVNHNGDIELAKKLVLAAKEAGADAVKFQTFKAENLATEGLKKANYQQRNDAENETQYQMLKRLELSLDHHIRLKELCADVKIQFLSSTFDTSSTQFLVEELGCKTVKVGSGDLTNAPLLFDLAQKKAKIILSTGMSTLSDIEEALGVMAYGYLDGSEPSILNFQIAYASEKGFEVLKDNVTILHCTSEYPCPAKDVNLRVMETIQQAFKLPVGFSDHSAGIHLAVGAVAMGATVIEKHFTLDKNLPGPDHKASLDPQELKEMISQIREIERALGTGRKVPSSSEVKTAQVVRKSLVATRDLKKGDQLCAEDVVPLRTEKTGARPIDKWAFIGGTAIHDISKGSPLSFQNIDMPGTQI